MDSKPVHIGPYIIHGRQNCTVMGESLPLIVISHGQGGSLLGHHDTATALANAGFTVVTFNHPGDSYNDKSMTHNWRVFETRPRDVSRVITYMTQNWPQRQQLDTEAIGVFGFSRGGYTALALAGAVPSAAASASRFCAHWWSFIKPFCRQLDSGETWIQPQADSRIRAVVVVDPLNLFDTSGLKSVHIPVQLWASELGGSGVALESVEAIRAALPETPEYHVAQGAEHYTYLAPCSPALKKSAPEICTDPPGFNRAAWHEKMNSDVVTFFKHNLMPRK